MPPFNEQSLTEQKERNARNLIRNCPNLKKITNMPPKTKFQEDIILKEGDIKFSNKIDDEMINHVVNNIDKYQETPEVMIEEVVEIEEVEEVIEEVVEPIEKVEEVIEEVDGDIVKFTEYLNKDAVDYICSLSVKQLKDIIYDNTEISNQNGDTYDTKTYIKMVMNYLKEMKKNNYVMKKSYKYSTSLAKNKEGRLFVKGFGVQSLQFMLRGFLLKGLWFDYDMRNAHPCILLKMVENEKADLNTMHLTEYVRRRNKTLKNKKLTKIDILKSINSDKKIRTSNNFLKGFDIEMKGIQDYYYNKYNHKYENTNKDNPKGSLLNKLLCINENKILQKVLKYCKKNKIDMCAPMFDGILTNNDNLIEVFNSITEEDGIEWKIKKHNDLIQIDEEELENPYSYDNAKKDFEKKHFMVEDPFMYGVESIDHNNEKCVQFFKHSQKNSFKDFTAKYEFEVDDDGAMTHILQTWLKDDNKRSYKRVDFLPPPLSCPKNIYNMYTGMEYQKWDNVKYDEDTNIDNILNLIKLLAGNERNEECADYLTKYLAHIIQRPGELPRTALIFCSEQGMGKNRFASLIGAIIGMQYTKVTTDLKDITGRFADNSKKFLSVLGEAQTVQAFTSKEQIKSLITDETINVERKGKDTLFNIHNTTRTMFFGNTDNIVNIEMSDRRFQPFKITCDKPSEEFYSKLADDTKDKEVLLKFAHYLEKIDISNFNFETDRIKTSYYTDQQEINIPIIAKYLQYKFDDKDTTEYHTASELYINYKNWLDKFHKNIDYTTTKFGRDINKFMENDAIKKGKTKDRKRCVAYTIDCNKLMEILKKKNYYDEVEDYETLKINDIDEDEEY